MNSLLQFEAYKPYLRSLMDQKRGQLSAMAKEAGCGHSYLSQVIHGQPHLTPDQAIALAEYLNLSADEQEYFLLLVMKDRAATQKLRAHFQTKLKKIREKKVTVKNAVSSTNQERLERETRDIYYSKWTYAAVHMLSACEEFQTSEAIAKRLLLPQNEVELILKFLADQKLVRYDGKKLAHSGLNIHLPTESIHNQMNHLNWRMRGITSGKKSEIHYTSVFAISKKDLEKLKLDLLKYIEDQRKKIGESGSEDAFVFCCDLYRV